MVPTYRAIMTKKDWIYLSILTVFSAIIIYTRLGATYAPRTGYQFQSHDGEQCQLILDLGETQEVSKMYIFQGESEKRNIAIASFNENTGKWDTITDSTEISTSFYWNLVPIEKNIRILGIVELDGEGIFDEIVLLDADGNRILPVNTDDYPTLFDEQEMFPETPTYYYRVYFDENYYARTAYEILHGLPIKEISHPPLGKELMSIGIRLFGMNPFGWRFVVALFGVLLTPLMYAFLLMLTKKTGYAVTGTILLNLDFMHYTLSRIGTIDSIVAFFIMASFFLMCVFIQKEEIYVKLYQKQQEEKKKLNRQEIVTLLLCGASIGCAIATKWTGVYAAAGLAVLFIVRMLQLHIRRNPEKERAHINTILITCFISFLCLPIIIYLLSYIPYKKTWDGNLIQIAVRNAKGMLNYHENIVFDHPFSSNWYEWVWMKTPQLTAFSKFPDGRFSMIVCFGNPVIWWSGIVAVIHNGYLWIAKKNQNAKRLLLFYATMFMPWLLIRRTVFIYQYYVCSLILILLLMNSFSQIKARIRIKISAFVITAALVFCMFYPIISGVTVSGNYVNHFLHWLPCWKFVDCIK